MQTQHLPVRTITMPTLYAVVPVNATKFAHAKAEMKNQNMDEAQFIKDGKLIFDDSDPYTLLKFLKDDLYVGV